MEKENTSRQGQVTFLGVCSALSQCPAAKMNDVRTPLNADDDGIRECAAPTVPTPAFSCQGVQRYKVDSSNRVIWEVISAPQKTPNNL